MDLSMEFNTPKFHENYAYPQWLLECMRIKYDEIHQLSSLKLKALLDVNLVAFKIQLDNNEHAQDR